jgi:adenine-specific DNA-methyltransferase
MSNLSKEEIEFITKCLKENKPLPDCYRYIIPFETNLHANSRHHEE